MEVKTMFNFLKKKKEPKPWLRFFSLEPGLAENYPLIPTASIPRQWMTKEQRSTHCPFMGTQNVANCPGLKLFARTGYCVTSPMDFRIWTDGDGISYRYEQVTTFARHSNFIGDHPPEQVVPLTRSKFDESLDGHLAHIIKLETPWRVRASDDIVFFQLPVYWNNETRFEAVAGLYDPRYAMQVNVQLLWKVLDSGEDGTLIKAGTPLAQFVPVRRKELDNNWYDMKIETASQEDWDLENAFNYSLRAEYSTEDTVSRKIKRAKRAIKAHTDGVNR